VRLTPLCTSATNCPIVPVPDDIWWWRWSSRWNENWQGKPEYSEKTCHTDPLSTTNPTWLDLGSNPANRCGKPVPNRLSYGTVTTDSVTKVFKFIYLKCKIKVFVYLNWRDITTYTESSRMKIITVHEVLTLCIFTDMYQCFGSAWYIRLEDRKILKIESLQSPYILAYLFTKIWDVI
jgi:hypothetical protein